MKTTNVFATKEELELLKTTKATSGIMIHIPRQSPAQLCHELALKHGLPEIEGTYGILPTGEFVS